MTKRSITTLAAGLALLGGALPEIKIPASAKRSMNDRRPVTPPRSMTPEELAYYNKNKTLKGFTNEKA